MRTIVLVLLIAFLPGILSATTFALPDEVLATFGKTWESPSCATADIESINDAEGPGVVYDIALAGEGEIEFGMGSPSAASDLTGYDDYVLTFTNLSEDDFFLVNLYVITGEDETYHENNWQLLAPGFRWQSILSLDPSWELDDVREIGFGLMASIGDVIPCANAILVKVEPFPVSRLSHDAATITWQTDTATTSEVEYGLTASYGQSRSDFSRWSYDYGTLEFVHTVSLSNLAADTTYHVNVDSEDYVFTTPSETLPYILACSPILIHGEAATIYGSNFGTHPGIIKYDDFENGVVGQTVSNGWINYDSVTYTGNGQRQGSSLSAYCNYSNGCPGLKITDGDWDELYISYWRKHHITHMGEPYNYKEVWLWGDNGSKTWMDALRIVDWVPWFVVAGGAPRSTGMGGPWNLHAHTAADRNHPELGTWVRSSALMGGSFTNDEWVRKEFWIRVGDSPGQRYKYFENAHLLQNFESPDDFPDLGDIGTLGQHLGDDGSSFWTIVFNAYIRGGSQGYTLWDDIYLSDTQARVEIGNAPTWDACTHREIQIPIDWSDGSITFTVNQGSFLDIAGTYLYVVDADGSVNVAGYPL